LKKVGTRIRSPLLVATLAVDTEIFEVAARWVRVRLGCAIQ